MPLHVLAIGTIVDRIGLSKPTIYRKISAGEFPKPISLGPQRIGFLEEEVDAWVKSRVAQRDAAEDTNARSRRAAAAVAQRADRRAASK